MTAILSVFSAFVLSCYLVGVPLWEQFAVWSKLGATQPETMGGLHQVLWSWIEVGSLKLKSARGQRRAGL